MIKSYFVIAALLILSQGTLFGQETYKMDFLTLFDKVPAVQTCDAAFNLISCKDNGCAEYRKMRAAADSSYAELARLQYVINTEMTSLAGPSMSAQDGKALAEKMKKMSKEEKIKWAMENSGKFMPANAGRVSKDIDNKPVNDAVAFILKALEADMMYYPSPSDCMQKFASIEGKNRAKLDAAWTKFNAESGRGQTIIAEGTEELWKAKYAAALKEYAKTVIPIYNDEIREKREYLGMLVGTLKTKSKPTEEKIASTHYGDDAKENVNKSHIIMAHLRVLGKVQEYLAAYGEIFQHYADVYTDLQKLEPVKD